MYSHLNESQQPGMVDVSEKESSHRSAIATATVVLGEAITEELASLDFQTHKGSILQTAIIAATMAAKRTAETIPLCHQIPLSSVKISTEILPKQGIRLLVSVKTQANTGVEMEALHAASVAALTIYDMCKSRSKSIRITDIFLLEKTGGKEDYQVERRE